MILCTSQKWISRKQWERAGKIFIRTHCTRGGKGNEVTGPYPKVRGVEISWSDRESKNCCLRVGEEIARIVFK